MLPESLNWLTRLKLKNWSEWHNAKKIKVPPLPFSRASLYWYPRTNAKMMNKWSSGLLTRDKNPDTGAWCRDDTLWSLAWLPGPGRDDNSHTFMGERDQHNDFCKKKFSIFLFNRNLIVLWPSSGELVNTASENLLRYFPIHSLIKGVR